MNNGNRPIVENCRDYLSCCDFAIKEGNPICNHYVREGGSPIPIETLKICPDEFRFNHINDEEWKNGD